MATSGASSAAVGFALSKLAALLEKEYGLLKGVKEKVQFLRREMEMMNVLLSNREEGAPLAETYVNQVILLADDIQKAVDSFMEMNPAPSDETKCGRLLRTFKFMKTLRSRHTLATEIAVLKSRVDELKSRQDRYNVNLNSVGNQATRTAAIDPRKAEFYRQQSDDELYDCQRDEANRLAEWLDGVEGTSRRVLAIVGMGGIGKTTLAKAIFWQLDKNKFKFRARVMVTPNFNAKNVLGQILANISPEGRYDKEYEQLVLEIQSILTNERYLILVDDLWTKEHWLVLKSAFPKSRHGGAIIVTTRDLDVANGCAADSKFELYPVKALNDIYAQKLFFKHFQPADGSGSSGNNNIMPPPYVMQLSKKILRICHGLPLAITTFAGLSELRSGGKVQWEEVLDSLRYEINYNNKGEFKGLLEILSLSYNRLPPELQKCLLYLSIFPAREDEIISKDQLVRQWIALDYVTSCGELSADKVANAYFNELVNRSLIDPVNVRYDGENMSCRVVKIMHELIIQKATKMKMVTLISATQNVKMVSESNKHWSLQNCEMPTVKVKTQSKSLSIFQCKDLKPLDLKNKFDSLRILNLKDCKGLDGDRMDCLCQLVQLRYLGLQQTNIISLPERIDKLESLMTLDLRATRITELPGRLVDLKNLNHLVYHSSTFPCLPIGIGKMTLLQTLYGFNICRSSEAAIGQLKELKNLRYLYFEGESVEAGEIDTQIESSILSVLPDLLQAKLCHLGLHLGSEVNMNFLHKLDELRPTEELQRFTMAGKIRNIPRWFCKLEALSYLQLGEIVLQKHDVEILGQLPCLMFLELKLHKSSETLSFLKGRFLSLTRLILDIPLKDKQENPIFECEALQHLELLYMFYSVEDHEDKVYKCSKGIQHLHSLREIAIGSIDEVKAKQLVNSIKPQTDTLPKHLRIKILRNTEEATRYYNQREQILSSYSEDLPNVERYHVDVQVEAEGSNGQQVTSTIELTSWQGENSKGCQVDGVVSSLVDASIQSKGMPVKEPTTQRGGRVFSSSAGSSDNESGNLHCLSIDKISCGGPHEILAK